jgi:glycosyltransferase involved in cell wall biosynthesis
MPLVDVITPTIPSRWDLLAEARESVCRQTYRDVGHLVSVDQHGMGQGFVRNDIILRSQANWLVFLDDDDLLDPDFVALHLEYALIHGADVVYALCRYPPGSEWRPAISAFDPQRLLREPYIPITTLVRRSAFEEVGGFKSTDNCEDHKLWLELLKIGARFRHLPKVCWTYRLHGNRWRPEVV